MAPAEQITPIAFQELLADPALARNWDLDPSHADGEVWLDATVRINQADFGLTWNLLGMVSMNNTITIHAVFTSR